jgi:hypothetical protein
MAGTDIMTGMQMTLGQQGGGGQQEQPGAQQPAPIQMLLGSLLGAIPGSPRAGGQGGPMGSGSPPFTSSRVMTGGALRPYNPAIDGPAPGGTGMMAGGKGDTNPLVSGRSAASQQPSRPAAAPPATDPAKPETATLQTDIWRDWMQDHPGDRAGPTPR